ncbi:hypothetical protein SAMN05518855_101576 [Paenibacillus sp. CF384]|nr:hypothetical protein SAMN05518855_101576 [Paenibacillus sp. CF384]
MWWWWWAVALAAESRIFRLSALFFGDFTIESRIFLLSRCGNGDGGRLWTLRVGFSDSQHYFSVNIRVRVGFSDSHGREMVAIRYFSSHELKMMP